MLDSENVYLCKGCENLTTTLKKSGTKQKIKNTGLIERDRNLPYHIEYIESAAQ